MTSLKFIPVAEYIKQYRKSAKQELAERSKYMSESSPKLFVFGSFYFCTCHSDNHYIEFDDNVESIIDTLEEYVETIAINKRAIKQVDYNIKPYHIIDYYFTLKSAPAQIYARYTNILLSEWFSGKWHREIEKITSRLVCLPSDSNLADYIIPDMWKDFKVDNCQEICTQTYDKSTLEFPDIITLLPDIDIESNKDEANTIAKIVSDDLGFIYDSYLESGK